MYRMCRHIKTNGMRCQAPAMTDAHYCYSHARVHVVGKTKPGIWDDVNLPVLEDPASIQIAISQVAGALLSSRIDARKAGLLFYGLQIATQNVDRRPPAEFPKTVNSFSQSSEGDELAPEDEVCEPGDCTHCPQRHTCNECDPDELEDEDEDEQETDEDEEGDGEDATGEEKGADDNALPR